MTDMKYLIAALDTLPTPVAMIQPDGVLLVCNRAWQEMGQKDAVSLSLFPQQGGCLWLNQPASPHALSMPDAVVEKIKQLLAGSGGDFEERFSFENGADLCWFHLRAAGMPDFPGHVMCYLQEITERARQEDQQSRMQEQFEFISTHLGDIIFRFRVAPEWAMEYISPSVEKITGYTVEEIAVNPLIWQRWVLPDDCPLSESGVVETASSKKFTIPLLCKDGRQIRLEISSALDFDEWGNLTLIYGFARDVTRQMQAEETYHTLVENAMEEMVIIQDGQVVYANPRVFARSGYSVEELHGKSIESLAAFIHPEDYSKAQVFFEAVASQVEGEQGSPLEIRFLYHAGNYRWVRVNVVSIYYKDRPAYLVMCLDISASKQAELNARESEEHFRALFEEAPLPYQSLDENGNILTINRAWESALGYSRDEVIGHSFGEFVTPPYAAAFKERFPRFKQLGKVNDIDFEMLRKDGKLMYTLFNGRIGHGPQGEFKQTHCIFYDVTEQKMATLKLQKSETRYRQLFDTMMNGFALHEIILDETGRPCDYRFLEINPAFETMAKISSADYIGKTLLELEPDTDPFWIDTYGRVALTGEPARFEHYFQDLDLYTNIYAYCPEKGQFATLVTDVTQRTRTEQMMRLVTSGLESAANGVVILDSQYIVQWVNPAFINLFRFSREELIGCRLDKVVRSGVHTPEFYAEIDSALAAGKSWNGEIINRSKDDELRHLQLTITPVAVSGEAVTHYIEIAQDITEIREYDRQQQVIVNVSHALRGAESLEQIVRIVMDKLNELIRTDGVALVLYDPQNACLNLKYAQGALESWAGTRLQYNQGVSGHVVSTRQIYVQNDMASDPHALWLEGRSYPRAMAGFPLISQDVVQGVLLVGKDRDFFQSDINVLTTVGDIVSNAMRRSRLAEETQRHLRQMEALHRIDKAIASNQILQETLSVLLNEVCEQLEISRAGIWLLEESTQTLRFKHGRGFTFKVPRFNVIKVGVGPIGRAALENRIVSLAISAATQEDRDALPTHWEQEGLVYHIAVPLVAKNKVLGVLSLYPDQEPIVNDEWWAFMEMLAGQCAIAVDNASMLQGLQRLNLDLTLAYDTTLEGWARALEIRDHETEGHSRRVTEMAMNLARLLGISEAEIAHVRRGALLHDIGKMGIPDNILNKAGPLTEEEWGVMRQHPIIAFRLLSSIAYLRPALDIPYCHHERWDGNGYPRRLKGEQIPLVARIFAVIDVWDALTSDRPYRPAWPCEKTLEYLREQSGHHFDPQVVDAFFKLLEQEGFLPLRPTG